MANVNTAQLERHTVEAALHIVKELPSRNIIEDRLRSASDSPQIVLFIPLIQELREGLLTAFTDHGIDSNGDPNGIGYQIEGLIDALYVDALYSNREIGLPRNSFVL